MEEQREEVRAAYQELREHYPALPEQLRDFQVGPWEIEEEANKTFFQADLVACAINDSETSHIMGALPTGYGKSLPMLVTGLLMPTGKCVNWSTAGVKICQSSFLTEVLYDRFNSHGHHRLDYDCSAIDQWLQVLWDRRLVIKPGKWKIQSMRDQFSSCLSLYSCYRESLRRWWRRGRRD